MRRFVTALLFASASLIATAANAQLNGRQVNGSIMFGANPLNYYDPANGFVPGGFGNSGGLPVTIGAGVEFGFSDGANNDQADFSNTQLLISDQVLSNAAPWVQTFTLVGGPAFNSLTLVSDNFVPGLTWSVTAGTIQINWAGTGAPNDFRALFDVGVGPAVPEPATWAMMIAGFGLAGAAMRRRQLVKVAFA